MLPIAATSLSVQMGSASAQLEQDALLRPYVGRLSLLFLQRDPMVPQPLLILLPQQLSFARLQSPHSLMFHRLHRLTGFRAPKTGRALVTPAPSTACLKQFVSTDTIERMVDMFGATIAVAVAGRNR